MPRFPQTLIAVPVADKAAAMSSPRVTDAVASAERELGADGRVLVRPSGTEPVIRVMVEARDETVARGLAARLAETVRTVAGR
jgi:phosphoglucosamine mutase